jgi:hypothetical protein
VSWADIKFGSEDAEAQVRQLLTDAERLRDEQDPDEENLWMGDIVSHLSIVAEELRSAYAKVGLI